MIKPAVCYAKAAMAPPIAIYPAVNPLQPDRDNLQPLQYQNNRRSIGRENCGLCHLNGVKADGEKPGHHPMTRRPL